MFEMPSPEAKEEALVKTRSLSTFSKLFLLTSIPMPLHLDRSRPIKGLLCMADKYQVTKILLWFKQERRLDVLTGGENRWCSLRYHSPYSLPLNSDAA